MESANKTERRHRALPISRRPLLLGAVGLIVAIALGGWWLRPAGGSGNEVSAVSSSALSVVSTSGRYRVILTPQIDPVVINQLHSWTVHVESVDGDPLEDATLSIDGDMPAHGHGLPADPQVTQSLGEGTYLIEGMKFQMGGDWVLDVTIEANGETDRAYFAFTIAE